jgi:hypothetical protein
MSYEFEGWRDGMVGTHISVATSLRIDKSIHPVHLSSSHESVE